LKSFSQQELLLQGFSSDLGGEQDEKARFGVKIGESESTSVSAA
jgi:hypothetical protein